MTDSQRIGSRNSVRAGRDDKRQRLVAAASPLLHRQGVAGTSLAQVAEAAEIPLGNVYYYFRTKDDLVRGVIGEHVSRVGSVLAAATAAGPGPADRLKALARHWVDMREVVARYGCPFGVLSTELDRRDDGLDQEAARPMAVILEWVEEQMRALGTPDPRERALTLLAGIQGAALLAVTFRDPRILTTQVTHLEQWIDALRPGTAGSARSPAPTAPPPPGQAESANP